MPTILVINDDGIKSIGLSILVKELKKICKVVIVTPENESSGVGKSICIGKVKITKYDFGDEIVAYSTTGTPADSYLLAVNKILDCDPDLVVSGINIGPNLGIDDLLTSGTIGACFEAAIHDIPAIAVSYSLSEITEKMVDKSKVSVEDLELAANVGYKIAKYVLEKGIPENVDIISINVPERADCKKHKITHLSYDGYGDIHTKIKDEYVIKSWALRHYPDGNPGTDLYAIKNEKCISITPIKLKFLHDTKAMIPVLKAISEN